MLKKAFTVTVVLLALGAIVLALPVQAQDQRWTGADNNPTNALDCPSAASAPAATEMAMATEAAATPMAYDGGQPTNPPDKSGQTITLIDVPKLIGIPYFAATTKGEAEAAAELGNVNVTTDGPTEGDVTKQVPFIDNAITSGVDGILFAADDPSGISPTLRRALAAGIHVVGYDANSEPDAREWFVNQAPFEAIAKALIDSMEAEIGDSGSFAIVTSSFTAPNQSRWIAEMQAYQEKCYPNMKWLETVESQEDQNQAFQQTQTLLNKYGDQVDGVFGMSSVAFPGAADAVQQAHLCTTTADASVAASSDASAVHLVGLSTPNSMKPFVHNGCTNAVVLWNPVDLGYAAVYVMRAVVDGTLKPGDTSVEAGRLGTLQVINGSEILLGPAFIFNKDNIDNFDF